LSTCSCLLPYGFSESFDRLGSRAAGFVLVNMAKEFGHEKDCAFTALSMGRHCLGDGRGILW
jgi:hypothetical protein